MFTCLLHCFLFQVEARGYKSVTCSCQYKCVEKLPEEERHKINQQFWNLGNWEAQSIFILQTIVIKDVNRRTNTNYNKFESREFYLKGVRVCKSVYLATLDVSNTRVEYLLKKKSKNAICFPEKRIVASAHYRKEENRKIVFSFLDSFPKLPSNNSSDNFKLYFYHNLSLKKLYNLYKDNYPKKTTTFRLFSKFVQEYGVGIYAPKSKKKYKNKPKNSTKEEFLNKDYNNSMSISNIKEVIKPDYGMFNFMQIYPNFFLFNFSLPLYFYTNQRSSNTTYDISSSL